MQKYIGKLLDWHENERKEWSRNAVGMMLELCGHGVEMMEELCECGVVTVMEWCRNCAGILYG